MTGSLLATKDALQLRAPCSATAVQCSEKQSWKCFVIWLVSAVDLRKLHQLARVEILRLSASLPPSVMLRSLPRRRLTACSRYIQRSAGRNVSAQAASVGAALFLLFGTSKLSACCKSTASDTAGRAGDHFGTMRRLTVLLCTSWLWPTWAHAQGAPGECRAPPSWDFGRLRNHHALSQCSSAYDTQTCEALQCACASALPHLTTELHMGCTCRAGAHGH